MEQQILDLLTKLVKQNEELIKRVAELEEKFDNLDERLCEMDHVTLVRGDYD